MRLESFILKKMISFIAVIAWMILIFFFSDMDGITSHTKSKNVVRSIVEEKIAISTMEVNENISNSDVGQVVVQEVDNEKETKVNHFVLKYDEIVRKTAHVLEYFVLFILVINCNFQVHHEGKRKYYLIGIIFCLLYACLDEFHQSFINGRNGQIKDVLIDSIGIVAGAIIVFCIERLYNTFVKLRANK